MTTPTTSVYGPTADAESPVAFAVRTADAGDDKSLLSPEPQGVTSDELCTAVGGVPLPRVHAWSTIDTATSSNTYVDVRVKYTGPAVAVGDAVRVVMGAVTTPPVARPVYSNLFSPEWHTVEAIVPVTG